MVTRIPSSVLSGIKGEAIDVEADIANGFPCFNIVGLPDKIINESKERIRTAVNNCGLKFPDRRVTINFVPAYFKKGGSHLDLPMALAMLSVSKQKIDHKHVGILGELSLTGDIVRIQGILPLLIALQDRGVNRVIIPYTNIDEAKLLKNLIVYPVKTLTEAYQMYSKIDTIDGIQCVGEYSINSNIEADFSEVAGQAHAKRVLEIAASGGHNVLMMGPPGSGKSMLAKRFTSIFPELSYEDIVALTKIYSVSRVATTGIISKRPYRSPHHTISPVSLCGGGSIPKPGEISLAHKGILFLDELPEFKRSAIESLRQPIEDKKVLISRSNGNAEFPADFNLVAAFNPCPCGYYGDKTRACTCTPYQIKNYLSKLSGPMIDRFDLQIILPRVSYNQLRHDQKNETSAAIKKRVEAARLIQKERFNTGQKLNTHLSPSEIKSHCKLSSDTEDFLDRAYHTMMLSARGLMSVLKVSRTIADLDGALQITKQHIAEALQYRRIDKEVFDEY